ncbi:Ca-activated chloride channel family protein [Lutibacter agarilyticus]|uniref:Ca-activated chloride channel family protein n=1 Tax=Lutibacter agarilyticus TaxID=1109740 RepID=A0A238Y2N3_9FLAO|nr:VWA domain-containing protein [Lutibacter agarilyticus]SNR64834.1 Ca-activated chloride channel family protein [Lutibacter agarilyticus]
MVDSFKNIDWENFHFLRPEFLWLFAPLAFILIFLFISFNEEVKWKKVIAPHLQPYVIKKGSESLKKWMQFMLIVAVSIATLGVAGPTWKMAEIPDKKLETPVVIALDLSQSMMATDIQPNRLERAKFKMKDLLAENPRARIALVGFSGSAHTIVPLTRDYKILTTHLDGLSPKMMPFYGTNLKAALKVIDTITAITTATAKLILVSDDFTEETFNLLKKYVSQGNVIVETIAMNTIQGADVPAVYGKGFLKDSKGKTVHSALNSEMLKKLNSIENIHVNALTLDTSDMELLAKSIRSNLEFNQENEDVKNDWQDEGYWLIFPLVFLVLLWFRKGWVIYSLLILVSFSSCSSEKPFKDLWFTKDYQGQKLANNGNYKGAAETFKDPLRKGVAYYKDQNYEQAIQAFQKDTTAMGAYNLGISYYKNGDYAAAELAFGRAVEMDPENTEALKNQQQAQQIMQGENEASVEDAEEAAKEKPTAKNEQNKSPEDLSGGGQEATKKDMEKERLEETVNTDVRKGKELDEVPDDFESGKQNNSQKVLMRKVDDDPALFLKRKFLYEVKKEGIKPEKNMDKW